MMLGIARRLLRIIGNNSECSYSDTPARISAKLNRSIAAGHLIMCNLGCGSRYHSDWVNIDFHGDGSNVLPWDLQQGLPLPDQSCDVIYSSHALEHFTRDGARRFLTECRRVLKSRGTLRLVAPDLEGIARAYLDCLDAARNATPGAADRYKWITIELLDHLVRHQSGGEMLKYWAQESVPAEDFVVARVGTEYHRARTYWKGRRVPEHTLDANAVGRFRLGGEVHQWMYDSYSLGSLLSECGYVDVTPCTAKNSYIPSFASYGLDVESDGSTYKPDSFFIEAKAP